MSSQQIFRTDVSHNPFTGMIYSFTLVLCFIFSFFIGTEYIAYYTGHPGLYQPFMEIIWTYQAIIHGINDEVFMNGLKISGVSIVVLFFTVNIITIIYRRKIVETDTYGSAEWAKEADLKKSNLLDQDEGIYLGGWEKKKGVIKYLKDNSESHVILIGPTGSGKNVGPVATTLLSYTGSVIVFDLKGENYDLTSGYRKNVLNQHVIKFNPTCSDMIVHKGEIDGLKVDWKLFSQLMLQEGWAQEVNDSKIILKEDINSIKYKIFEMFPAEAIKMLNSLQQPHEGTSACFNPLQEVRLGLKEVQDVQLNAEMIIDPYGRGDLDHWHRAAKSLLVGIILHVIYARIDKTIGGVVDLLSDTKRPIYDVLESMLLTEHDPKGIYGWIDKSTGLPTKVNPIVAAVAREMKNKQFEELSGIVSTALSFLTLYRDPIIRRNTSKSDFTILDLIKSDKPVSLYIIVPPSDLQRVVPLTRLLVNLICTRLMENK